MKTILLLGSLVLCIFLSAPAGAANKGTKNSPTEEEKAWMAAAQPGTPHQQLAAMVGTWGASVKSWMDPSAPPTESKGVAEMSMELGGRYLLQKFHGTMMGQPFEGMGYTGYDNAQKKYVSTWMDNMSTAIMSTTGTPDPATGKTTYTGSIWNPMSGAPMKTEQVISMIDADHCSFQMYMEGPNGAMMKVMEIDYTRRK
jgi:hypothetical protein